MSKHNSMSNLVDLCTDAVCMTGTNNCGTLHNDSFNMELPPYLVMIWFWENIIGLRHVDMF